MLNLFERHPKFSLTMFFFFFSLLLGGRVEELGTGAEKLGWTLCAGCSERCSLGAELCIPAAPNAGNSKPKGAQVMEQHSWGLAESEPFPKSELFPSGSQSGNGSIPSSAPQGWLCCAGG